MGIGSGGGPVKAGEMTGASLSWILPGMGLGSMGPALYGELLRPRDVWGVFPCEAVLGAPELARRRRLSAGDIESASRIWLESGMSVLASDLGSGPL